MVLAVVLVILCAGCLVTAARQVHASRVTGSAQAMVAGAMAQQAASAALEEALLTVGQRANSPADPLFAHLRQVEVPAARELTVATPLTVAQLQADPYTASVALLGGGVHVELLERRRIGLASYEHEGRVRLVAQATHRPTGVVRRLTREHTLRVNHLSTPRPFDQFTWMAVSGERLLDPAANERMAAAVEALDEVRARRAPALAAQVRQTVEQLNRLLAAISGDANSGADPEELARLFAPERFPAAPRIRTGVGEGLHWFPQSVALFSKTAAVGDLAWLYLKPRADRASRDAEAAWRELAAATARFEETLGKLVASVRAASARTTDVSVAIAAYAVWMATVPPLAQALERAARARENLLVVYREYQDRVAELTGRARSYILDQARQFDPAVQRARAAHRFDGPDAAARAERFLAGYMGPAALPARGLHAVVSVDNRGGPPLTLDGLRGPDGVVRIRGKVALSVSGAVQLSNVVLADRATDTCVVYAGGTLGARDRVEASLIAGDEVHLTADLKLSGNLILAGAFDPARLAGRIDRDGGRYVSGAGRELRGAYTHAALSPWALRSFVERSAP